MGFLVWLGFCFWVAHAANKKGKSGVLWFIVSLIFSPLIGGLIVGLSKDRRHEDSIRSVDRKVENVKQEVDYNQKFNDYRATSIEKKIDQLSEFAMKQNLNLDNNKREMLGEAMVKCDKCREEVQKNAKFCPHCGESLEKFCKNCNTVIQTNHKFCPTCGENNS